MTIKEIKISELKEYENNPRINDNAVDKVAASIKEFGFKVPIIIDKDNVIFAGHTRLKAAQKLGLEKVPCIVAYDLTEEQVKAFRLADNKTAELAEWEFDKLQEELEGIFDINMQDFGFVEQADVDWASVDELNENTYDKPEKTLLECPHCHHIDSASHFKKVEAKDEDIKELEDEDIFEQS